MSIGDKPAYPGWHQEGQYQTTQWSNGMTLRQYYAGLVMQGLLSGKMGDSSSKDWVKDIVEASVEFSDALISELEKSNGNA